jgi:glyoxylase-like metal-dependent hydrolase (beta-lactamase superfamily II)
MSLQIDALELGPFQTNCYVLREGDCCWLVDVGFGPGPLLELLKKQAAGPQRILLTHGHGDHIAGVAEVKAAYPRARLCCPAADDFMLADGQANLSAMFGLSVACPPADELLQAGRDLDLRMGPLTWHALDTSGHSPGGMSFYCPQAGVVLTGDALFAGSIGRTDLPGAAIGPLIKNIRLNLLALPGPTKVLPGHGPPSTIQQELEGNPFLAIGRGRN